MNCQSDGCDRDATHHETIIEDGRVKEVHLCEECAREKTEPVQKTISLSDILSTLLSQIGGKGLTELANVSCPSCGMSYTDFRSSGRLGCGHDYEAFELALVPLLEKIQYAAGHTGKQPGRQTGAQKEEHEILRLRRALERAVQREEYETAAELRDRLNRLTEQANVNG